MKPWLKFLLKIAVPVIVLIILYQIGLWYGIAGTAILVLFLGYRMRANYYVFQANTLYAKKDLKGTVEAYNKAYKINRRPGLAISKAFVQLKLGEIEEAEKLLSQVMQRKLYRTDQMNAKINYSLALWMLGKKAEAVDLMEELLPAYKNSIVYGNLGMFYLMNHDLDKALALNLEAYEYNDSDKSILDNLGYTYYLLGRYEDAKEIYEKLMALTPAFAEAYYYYALTLHELGEQRSALEVMGKGLSYEPAMITTVNREMFEEKLQQWSEDKSLSQ